MGFCSIFLWRVLYEPLRRPAASPDPGSSPSHPAILLPRQRRSLRHMIDADNARPLTMTAAVAALLEARQKEFESCGPVCPRCGDDRVWMHGRSAKRQRRYRCRRCRRTFTETTGTLLANPRGSTSWHDHAACMDAGLTLRETAARLGVAVATAFRWRHAVLNLLASARPPLLRDALGFADMWLPVNEKGRRDLDRPARTHGVRCRFRFKGPSVRALMARDLSGAVLTRVAWIGLSPPSRRDLIEAFAVHVAPGTAVHSWDGPISTAGRFAQYVGGPFRMAGPVRQWRARPGRARPSGTPPGSPPWPGKVEPVSVDCDPARSPAWTARTYALDVRRWLQRFHGVATKYLHRYLAWHPIVDRARSAAASGANDRARRNDGSTP